MLFAEAIVNDIFHLKLIALYGNVTRKKKLLS